jgi:transcriptional regulator with XRE-family HTH domain
MAEEFAEETTTPAPGGIGAQLRAAREGRGLTLAQVAAETRIPQRHLQTIESGDFAALPARTYAVGFSRTYAKVVGLDEADVADLVRAELDAQEPRERSRPATFEPGDPARVPSRGLFWVVVAAVVLLLLGGYFFMRTMFAPAGELPSLVAQEEAEQAAQQEARQQAAAAPRPAATGPVVFTALEDGIWVRFYDADGMRLMEKQMARGESYTVPAEAPGPQLWTGRPDALAITVGGRQVPKLAEDDTIVRDVPVTAEALLARPAPAATPVGTPAAGAAPAASPTA